MAYLKLCEKYHLGNALGSRLVTKECKMKMVPPPGLASGLPVGLNRTQRGSPEHKTADCWRDGQTEAPAVEFRRTEGKL